MSSEMSGLLQLDAGSELRYVGHHSCSATLMDHSFTSTFIFPLNSIWGCD
jgi:hypothetical protein